MIIDSGGHIFFALHDVHIIGCFAFIPLNGNIHELGKMAIDPKYRGQQIGEQLLKYAIGFAKMKHWNKIVLYSSTKLDAALHIYGKSGFKEVELETDLPYARSDIKMELHLT